MKTQDKLERSDKVIVGLASLCALLFFSWLTYDILFNNPDLEGQVTIGEIYETQNKVKRKFNRSLIWYSAGRNETVYENDWIFTGSNSIAKIRLQSGGEIVVEPDSLIVLSRKNGVLQLDLQHGRLMAKVKPKSVKINVVKNGLKEAVDTSGGIVSVGPSDEDAGDVEIDLLDLNNKEGEEVSLSDLANQKYFTPPEDYAKLDSNNLSFKLDYDFFFKRFRGEKVDVALDWLDPFEKWSTFDVEVASDKDFSAPLASGNAVEPNFAFQTGDAGLYYFRVRGRDVEGQEGSWSDPHVANVNIRFIDVAEPPKLSRNKVLYQLDREELNRVMPDKTYDVAQNKVVKIDWQANEEATGYKVEVSDKADFSNILAEKVTEETELQLDNLKIGETFFRVTPETKQGIAVAKPAVGKVMSYFPAPEKLKTRNFGEGQLLEWEEVPYAEAYQVTYKTERDGEEEFTEIVSGNKMEISTPTGFLQWNVRVVDPKTKKVRSSQSATVDWYDAAKRLASLHGTGQAGKLYPKITKPEPRKTFISVNQSPLFIVMNWTYEKPALAYEVEISKKPDMSALIFKRRVETQRAVVNKTFSPGIYFMRVRAIQKDVTKEAWSEVEVFRVLNRSIE